MSERTAHALKQARVTLSAEATVARIEQRRILRAIAGTLPDQLAQLARAEIEVQAASGGPAPRPHLEVELRDAAAAFAARIRAGIDNIRWPGPEDGFDVVATVDAAAAVYGYIGRSNPLQDLLLRHSRPGRDPDAVRRILAPRPFFDAGAFVKLAGLLNRVAAAESALRSAERHHANSILANDDAETVD